MLSDLTIEKPCRITVRISRQMARLLDAEMHRIGKRPTEIVRVAIHEYFDRPVGERGACLKVTEADIQRRILGG